MLQPIFLHREFQSIIDAVSDRLLDQLKLYNETITKVHYHYGHPLEIINTITQLDQGKTTPYDKYPLVAFFLDSKVTRNNVKEYGTQRVHLAIINQCKDANGNEVAKERDENNFIPVLSPIYMELMREIKNRQDLFSTGFYGEAPPHDVTFRYYWGKSELFKNSANIFNDRIDAIEVENLQLTINLNYCPKAV